MTAASAEWTAGSIARQVGKRAAGRAVAGLLGGPIGWAVVAGLTAYDVYGLIKMYNESQASDKEGKGDCTGKCAESKETQEKANDIHDNPEQFKDKDYDDVEKTLDEDLRDGAGWEKKPNRDGSGERYISPDGNRSVRINRGYPGGSSRGPSDYIHQGPYIKTPSNGKSVPLYRPPKIPTS